MSLGSLGRLGIEIYADTAQFTGDLGKAEKGAKQFATNVEASIGKLTGIFTGLAATLGVIKFAGLVEEVAQMRAGLDDLADAGLGTVESLSRIKNAAKAFGGDFDQITGALSKMVNGLAGSEKETSKAGEALRRLGISARDSSGNLRAPAEIFEQLAGTLSGYADGADKAAFAQAILGKGAERFLPILKDMAEQGTKVATVTARQAAEADQYDKAMRSLATATESVAKKIAGEFIPAATAFAGALTDTLNANNGLKKSVGELAADGSIQNWAYTAGAAVANLVDVGLGASRAFETIGKAIAETGRNAADFSKIVAGALLVKDGNSVKGMELIKEGYSGLKTMGAEFSADLEKIANRAWFSDTYAAKYAANMKKLGEAAGEALPKLNSAGLGTADKKDKNTPDPFAAMMADAQKQLATAYAETLDPLNDLTAAEKALIAVRESVNWEQITTEQRIQIRETLEQAAALQKVVAGQKEWNKTVDEAKKFADEFNRKQDEQTVAISAKAAAINAEADNWGKLPSEIAAVTLAENEEILARLKLQGASEDLVVAQENLVKSQRNYVAALQRKEGIQAGEQMLKIWDDVATAGARFFADLVTNGRSAFGRLRDSLKQFGADLVALFAKKWLLNMAASVSGDAGIASMAASVGGNTIAGAAGNFIMGSAAAGTGIAGAASNFAMGFSAPGVAAPGLFADAGAALAGMGPVGWAILAAAAVAAVVNLTRDKENPRVKLGFGSAAQGYVSQGLFGAEGFNYIETNDAGNQALRDFMKSLKPLDERIAKFLSAGQIAGIGAALNAQGQREFSFAPGDNTASAQITLEYLKQKYSIVFRELDATFADFVANFTGSAEDLTKAIVGEANVLDMLDPSTMADFLKGIPDLTVEGLRKVQQAGEALSDTFTRVVNEFLSAQNALNQAIAARNPTFGRDLVLNQRNAIGSQFAALTGNTYGADLAARMALDPQSFTGLGTDAMNLLAQWLGLQTQLEQLDAQLATSGNAANDVATSFNNAANAANDYAASLFSSQTSLAQFLNNSILSDTSPLTPEEKYREARRQLDAQFALADAGNVDAIAGLGSFLQSFWDASSLFNAAGGNFNSDYMSTFNRAAALTGGQARPLMASDYISGNNQLISVVTANGETQVVTNQILVEYLNLLSQGQTSANSPAALALLAMLNDRARINGGFMNSNAATLP